MRAQKTLPDSDPTTPKQVDPPSAPNSRISSTAVSVKESSSEPVRIYRFDDANVQKFIDTLQKLIDTLEKKSRPSKLSLLAHPLTVALIGSMTTVLLGGIIGGRIAYEYNKRSQADARRQSELDGINNARIPKLGEVWEQLDADDLLINQLLDQSGKPGVKRADQDTNLQQIVEILKKDRQLVGRNRFWLGDCFFKMADDYLDRSIAICLSTIVDSNPDLSKLRDQKDAARQDIIKIRDMFLEGNSNC